MAGSLAPVLLFESDGMIQPCEIVREWDRGEAPGSSVRLFEVELAGGDRMTVGINSLVVYKPTLPDG